MTYVSWGVVYEGSTDQAYFDVLIPRLMEDLIAAAPKRNTVVPAVPAVRLARGSVEDVAKRVCEEGEAYHLIFIHADTGGRALEATAVETARAYREALLAECGWPAERCVIISPRHETEAWLLADPQAIADVLGYRGNLERLSLPDDAQAAERVVDPKAVLRNATDIIRGRRRPMNSSQIFPAVAQRQRFDLLRRSQSFRDYETQVSAALRSLDCIV